MQSVYNLLILSQHVAAQLQTRHFECEKFLFKVVLLSSASIARANRFGFGRLCWTTCTNSTSSKASHKSEQKNANRKSNREQQIIINYPTLSKSCKNSSWILDWAEHGQDLHESHPKTGFSLRFCYLPPYKTARAFCSLLDRVCVCVIIQVIMCHRCEGLIPHRQGHLCPQAAIELAKVLLRVSVTSWSWKQRFRTKLQTIIKQD